MSVTAHGNKSSERAENSFKQLASAAQALSSASDDLSKVIRHFDASLKKLALGITVWIEVSGTADDTQYWRNELGYAKIDGKWGIALREVTGYHLDPDDSSIEEWIYNEAPRAMRAEAVGKIPDLLEKMLQQTEETTKDLRSKIEEAAELAYVVANLVPSPPPPPPQQWHRPSAETASEAAKPHADQNGRGGDKPAIMRFREVEGAGKSSGSSASAAPTPLPRPLPPERPLEAPRPLPAERPS
jgi:hypothetical protein